MIYRILAIALILLSTIGYSLYSRKSLETVLLTNARQESVLKRLPEAQFETLDGQPFLVDELFIKDRVELLVVHFWGTWCAPCEAELPDLLTLIKRYENRPSVKFLLVATSDEALKVKKHLKKFPVIPESSIYWLLDNKNVHRDLFGTTRVPETYVFSSDKTVLRKFVGPQEWGKQLFFQIFDELLLISTRKM